MFLFYFSATGSEETDQKNETSTGNETNQSDSVSLINCLHIYVNSRIKSVCQCGYVVEFGFCLIKIDFVWVIVNSEQCVFRKWYIVLYLLYYLHIFIKQAIYDISKNKCPEIEKKT